MIKDKLLKLDNLREEKRELEYFLNGNGNFGITIDMKLFKHFGCGQRELYINNNYTQELIFDVLKERLESINIEIEGMF